MDFGFGGIGDILGGIGGGIGDLFGGAVDLFNPATSNLYSGAANVAGQVGGGIADLGSSLWGSIAQNPYAAINAGLGVGNTLGGLLMGGQQQPQQMGYQNPQMYGGFDQGAQTQMQQPGGPTPQQLRRNIGDAQARGLSGASPDFMASMAGVTPQELDQMLGYRFNAPGAS